MHAPASSFTIVAARGQYTVRPAAPDEVPLAIDILEAAASWVRARGIDHWVPGSFRDGKAGATVLRRAAAGTLYLVSKDGEDAATVALELDDSEYWPDVTAGDSIFVHGFAVRREHAGLGQALLVWAEERCRELRRTMVRLDCAARNPVLPAYYAAHGFRLVDRVVVHGRLSCRFERRVGR